MILIAKHLHFKDDFKFDCLFFYNKRFFLLIFNKTDVKFIMTDMYLQFDRVVCNDQHFHRKYLGKKGDINTLCWNVI